VGTDHRIDRPSDGRTTSRLKRDKHVLQIENGKQMSSTVSFIAFANYIPKNLILEREFKIQSFYTNFAHNLIIDTKILQNSLMSSFFVNILKMIFYEFDKAFGPQNPI
jgi:hypothetical protein